MNLKNIFTLSIMGGLLVVLLSAAAIVNPLFYCVAAGVGVYLPEAFSEIE
jgi:hypothetical protein